MAQHNLPDGTNEDKGHHEQDTFVWKGVCVNGFSLSQRKRWSRGRSPTLFTNVDTPIWNVKRKNRINSPRWNHQAGRKSPMIHGWYYWNGTGIYTEQDKWTQVIQVQQASKRKNGASAILQTIYRMGLGKPVHSLVEQLTGQVTGRRNFTKHECPLRTLPSPQLPGMMMKMAAGNLWHEWFSLILLK